MFPCKLYINPKCSGISCPWDYSVLKHNLWLLFSTFLRRSWKKGFCFCFCFLNEHFLTPIYFMYYLILSQPFKFNVFVFCYLYNLGSWSLENKSLKVKVTYSSSVADLMFKPNFNFHFFSHKLYWLPWPFKSCFNPLIYSINIHQFISSIVNYKYLLEKSEMHME